MFEMSGVIRFQREQASPGMGAPVPLHFLRAQPQATRDPVDMGIDRKSWLAQREKAAQSRQFSAQRR